MSKKSGNRTQLGVWIDHRQTLLVTVGVDTEESRRIVSEVEPSISRAVEAPSGAPSGNRSIRAVDQGPRIDNDPLKEYYDEVIAALGEASSILIMGPGEAKVELQRRLQTSIVRERVSAVIAVESMTTPQIAQQVREHFKSKFRPK